MDQIKIGKFIALRRKKAGLTQAQLAEKLCITDRAVSKWETGRAIPDSSIMLELCDVLEITVTDLLKGEVVFMEEYNNEMQNTLMEMIKQKERADKRLLHAEYLIGAICVAFMLALIALAAYVNMELWLRITLIIVGIAPVIVVMPFMIKIEQTAGYYECAKCGHRYIPKYISVFMAPHMGRTRYMRCPECQKISWQKKMISKDDNDTK